jgi:hypothetical protein
MFDTTCFVFVILFTFNTLLVKWLIYIYVITLGTTNTWHFHNPTVWYN